MRVRVTEITVFNGRAMPKAKESWIKSVGGRTKEVLRKGEVGELTIDLVDI